MKISIFTDASIGTGRKTKAAGYAFYIGCSKGKIQKAGILKEANGPTLAELQCIANALHILKHSKLPPATSVFIYTDSKDSYMCLSDNAVFKSPNYKNAVLEIQILMMEYCLHIGHPIRHFKTLFKVEYIKGHRGHLTDDKYAAINTWCDQQAKLYMKKAEKEKILANKT